MLFPSARHRRAAPPARTTKGIRHVSAASSADTLTEVAVRWDCSIADIVEWAFSGHLEIPVAIPTTRSGGQLFSDMVAVAPCDVLQMWRRYGSGPDQMVILRVRASGSEVWSVAHPPEQGGVHLHDLMISLGALAKSEDRHSVFRRCCAGSVTKCDWHAFRTVLMVRIHEKGLQGSMTELVGEMQDWFIRHSPNGEAPGESTIRKRTSPIWHQLRAPVPA